ncbi:kinase-like domain, phloem protein 2-like protein, partial [Tanacetum coccineum]
MIQRLTKERDQVEFLIETNSILHRVVEATDNIAIPIVRVYSSSSDPVCMPSLASRPVANVGAIKREVDTSEKSVKAPSYLCPECVTQKQCWNSVSSICIGIRRVVKLVTAFHNSHLSFLKVNHDDLHHFKIPLEDVLSATNNFAKANIRGYCRFGNHYKGEFMWSGKLINISACRLNKKMNAEKEQEFWMEIFMLSSLEHKNLVSLVGFCDENGEKIIIIKRETRGSLVNYLSETVMLTWVRRLEICVGVAHALSYIHYDKHREFGVIHRNINSETILLNYNWEPNLSEFRLSIKIEASQRHHSFHVDKVRDRKGYTDPTYLETKSAHHKEKILDDTIDPDLWKQMDPQSFN